MYRFTISALQVKILTRILGQQPLPTELMDFYAQLVGILSTLTPADLSALLDKVALSSMVPSSLSDSPPSVTMHQDLTTSSPAHFGEEQTQADESKLQTNQSLQQSLAVIRSQRCQPRQHPAGVAVQQSLWQAVNDPAIRINLAVNAFIARLAVAHKDSSMFNSGEWAHSVNSLLTSVKSTNDYLDKSLASVVAHSCCQVPKQGISLANLWRDLPQPKPSKKRFEQWHAMGCKFAAIAAGGSIYALVLVAGLNLRVQLGEMDETTPWEIANVFRWPVESTISGQLVISRIIPTTSSLRQNLPLNMNCMFAPGMLSYYGLPANIDCTNLGASDQIFKAIRFNTFQPLDCHLDCWGAILGVGTTSSVRFLTPLSDLDNILPCSQPPSPSLPPVILPKMYLVSMTFQNMAKGNRQYSAPQDPGNNYKWTESERERASQAIKVTDVEDLMAKIQKHYDGGRCFAQVIFKQLYARINSHHSPA
ncbi:hypothetical protein SERLA73DRAFT_74440 [Serpula lacrymans var. lacrymans S7.3]|uniref:Uncharacterized protein n=2 Tax=Serpula lacrymans var. lacrymans TaxID=341189 RepID=F8Q1M9_SERL3|nr:uncharacterized protein SERLADRAFT_439095 [Serpula lacrymans var. lacrymans S7.9]EGN98207.1 hypothetical protein SERLA73DRAFT_74440 [Serpula lacrymans var. lacrymans S7.3]EGO23784.1 hypothetical protein SERLADRAFT_439095 [Serpula lacrymans var. lacrymans S7.9]